MFVWWNEAFARKAMTREGFARFFTEDAVFIVNGSLRGKGPADLAAFFGGQDTAIETAVMKLPFLKTFSEEDCIFLDYDMHIGKPTRIEVYNAKGYARIKGGKIDFYAVNKFER